MSVSDGGTLTGPTPMDIPPSKWMILEGRIEKLEQRVRELEQSRPMPVDDISGQAFEFLKRMNGVKFNTGSISSNIGTTSMKISDKLKTMADKGLIKTEKLEGHSTMYWYEASSNNSEDE